MTDYQATSEQWTEAEYYGNLSRLPRPLSEYACILELRARIEALEAARPKPPSLKEQALEVLMKADGADHPVPVLVLPLDEAAVIRRALEQLDG